MEFYKKTFQTEQIRWLLLLPTAIALVALLTDNIVLKMSVPSSCALLLSFAVFSRKKISTDIIWVIAALLLSAIGDWFLSTKDEHIALFITGIGFYFVAHAGYLIFSLMNGRLEKKILTGLLSIYLFYYVFKLYPAIRHHNLSAMVLFYLLISCFVLAAASGLYFPLGLKRSFILGITLLVLSDTIISFTEFLDYRMLNRLILPTYYLAHLCISWSLLGWIDFREKQIKNLTDQQEKKL